MTQYTNVSKTDIVNLLENIYGLNNVLDYKLLSGGSENTNFWVKTKKDELVLTICEQKTLEQTLALAQLLEYLNNNKFKTSKVVKTFKGELVATFNEKPVLLKNFIQGDIVEDLSLNTLEYLGRELAKLHKLEAPNYIPKELSYDVEKFDEVAVYAPDSDFYEWLKSIKNYIIPYTREELPKGLIHSDIFYNNVIVNPIEGIATIMDFEEASFYYRVFDIGMMLIGTCSEGEKISFEKIKILLKGYEEELKLSKIERESLQVFTVYAAAATAFWRHKNFNYVNVDEKMKKHYLKMKNLADYVKNVPSVDFEELLNM